MDKSFETKNFYQQLEQLKNQMKTGTLRDPEKNTYKLVKNVFKLFNIDIDGINAQYGYPVPGFNNDKKEKNIVDIAIKLPKLLFVEVKRFDKELSNQNFRQIYGYLNNTADCNVGILTNGIKYHFIVKRADNNHNRPIIQFFEFNMEKRDQIDEDLLKANLLFKYQFSDTIIESMMLAISDADVVKETIELFYSSKTETIHIDTSNENAVKAELYEIESKKGVINFAYNTVDISSYVNKNTKQVLFGFNMINCFGHISPDKTYFIYSSQDMENNQNAIKKLKNATFVILGDETLFEYIKSAFCIMGINDKKLVFKKINNSEFDKLSQLKKEERKNELDRILRKIKKSIEFMKFDTVILNPPYLNGIFKSILDVVVDATVSDLVVISPISYYKKTKGSFINKVNTYDSEVVLINHEDYFNGANAGLLAVTHINMNSRCDGVRLYENFDKYHEKEHMTIDKIGDFNYANTNRILSEVISVSKRFIKQNGSLDSIVRAYKTAKYGVDDEKTYPEPFVNEKYVIQLSTLTGKWGQFYNGKQFTFFNEIPEVELYSDVVEYNEKQKKNDDRKLYFCATKTKKEAKNLQLYLQTDAARAFLAISKMVPDVIGSRACKSVPLIDLNDDSIFNGSLIDINKKIISYFGFSKSLIDLIKTHPLFENIYNIKDER